MNASLLDIRSKKHQDFEGTLTSMITLCRRHSVIEAFPNEKENVCFPFFIFWRENAFLVHDQRNLIELPILGKMHSVSQ
jgi:hypothetical protein